MHVAMRKDELLLFESFVRCARTVVEFGSGGSTWLAAQTKKDWIISVDSSLEWLNKVADETKESPTRPELVHVDIGPLGNWGYPSDDSRKSTWAHYHEHIWSMSRSNGAEFCF